MISPTSQRPVRRRLSELYSMRSSLRTGELFSDMDSLQGEGGD